MSTTGSVASNRRRRCDGRTGEKLCKCRYLVPLIVAIVVIQLLLWKYFIYPKAYGYVHDVSDADSSAEYDQNLPEKTFMEDSDEDQNEDEYGGYSSQYPLTDSSTESSTDPPTDSEFLPHVAGIEGSGRLRTTKAARTSTERQMESSVANYEQKFLDRMKHRRRQHKNRYFVTRPQHTGREQQPNRQTYTQSYGAPRYPTTRPMGYPSTTRTPPVYTNSPRTQPTVRLGQYLRAQNAQGTDADRGRPPLTTPLPTATAAATRTATTYPSTTSRGTTQPQRRPDYTPPSRPQAETPANKHHAHFQQPTRDEQEALRVQQERERQLEEREQERMRALQRQEQDRRLTDEQQQRAQRIYEQQQAELKRSREDAELRRAHAEEQRRLLEHQRKIKQWSDEDFSKQPQHTTTTPRLESNQWHHPDSARQQQLDQMRPDVVDPWAHLRQLHEQRGPAPPGDTTATPSRVQSNEVDPFQVITHSIDEAPPSSDVYRGHVDHHNQHQQQQGHQQGHHQQRQRQQQQHEAERRVHEKKLEEARRQREEHQKRLHQHHHGYSGVNDVAEQQHHQDHHRLLQKQGQEPQNNASNEVSSPSQNDLDKAPVIVTVLLDIGRGDWHTFTRPFDHYLDHLMDLLKLKNRMVIYGDRSVLDFLQAQGPAINPDRLQLVEITLQELPYYRYRQEMSDIMAAEQKDWSDKWEKATKTHPEAINPDYNILVNSKPYLMYNATQISRFKTDKFIWLDAGYSHGQEHNIPEILWNPHIEAGKITAIKITGEQDIAKNYKIEHVYRKQWTVMAGGFLAGDVPTIDRFRRFYHKVFMDILDSKKTDDDQTTLLMTIASYHSLFRVLHGGWFDAFKLLPSQ